MLKLYKNKQSCIKNLTDGYIIANVGITSYFQIENYHSFLALIEKESCPMYFEYISDKQVVKLYFDIEIYKKDNLYFNDPTLVLECIKNVFGIECIVLESHCITKKSLHIIYPRIHFANVLELKHLVLDCKSFQEFVKLKIIDTSVYRSGLFRTIFSTKKDENRPFIISKDSTLSNPIDSFIGYIPNQEYFFYKTTPQIHKVSTEIVNTRNLTDDTDSTKVIKQKDLVLIHHFLRKFYNHKKTDIRQVKISGSSIIIALNDLFCDNIDREHKSNHQYIVIDASGSRQKCHDLECGSFKKYIIDFYKLPDGIQTMYNNYFNPPQDSNAFLVLGKKDCPKMIYEAWHDTVDTFNYDTTLEMFTGDGGKIVQEFFKNGLCSEGCQPQHCIVSNGFYIKCKVCGKTFPPYGTVIPCPEKYTGLQKHYYQINLNVTINNTTNNYISNIEDYSCDVDLDPLIFDNEETTMFYNQILSGHKIVKISELLSNLENDFVYTDKEWFHFNGMYWKIDKESLILHNRIVLMSIHFDKITKFYKDKPNTNVNEKIIKNVSSLIEKLHKPGFEDDIVKGAKYYYQDEDFRKKLDSKKHLVPLKNGVYDVLERKFRKAVKKDYINMTVDYDYDPNVSNPDVYKFIEQVLPIQPVRDYVLKKFAECLNADIPNTHFLMFIGDGANGKSQLLNLMKYTMGDFGDKVEVTLLTRKRGNANETNSEKMKLKNKRFAFLSEPEDGESFNISLLKEMTGSEEIVARGLYKESCSFNMEAKLFLGCNELPPIKGEDKALWRRIRVVNFISKFIEDPLHQHEHPIDITLPSRMKTDITWRQTFFNILLDYYYKKVPEPEQVKITTLEYQEDNNEIEAWLKEHIIYEQDAILQLKEVVCLYTGVDRVHSKVSSKFKKQIEDFIKSHFVGHPFIYTDSTFKKSRYRGWLNFKLV
jgi:P4 family phage/plasmid primase-like protien